MLAVTAMASWLLSLSAVAGLLALLLYSQKDVLYVYTSHSATWLGLPCKALLGHLVIGSGATDAWNQLYHLGGNSPWIPKINAIVDTSLYAPAGCRIDQVHMVRHEYRSR